MPFANDITGGVRMKMARAALRLTAINLLEIFLRFAVIGNQRQVDCQRLWSSSHGFGHTIGQRLVQSFLEFVVLRQRRDQCVEHGLLCRCVHNVPASSEDRTDSGSCEEEDI